MRNSRAITHPAMCKSLEPSWLLHHRQRENPQPQNSPKLKQYCQRRHHPGQLPPERRSHSSPQPEQPNPRSQRNHRGLPEPSFPKPHMLTFPTSTLPNDKDIPVRIHATKLRPMLPGLETGGIRSHQKNVSPTMRITPKPNEANGKNPRPSLPKRN